jgi:hypothetical protein
VDVDTLWRDVVMSAVQIEMKMVRPLRLLTRFSFEKPEKFQSVTAKLAYNVLMKVRLWKIRHL